MGHESLQMRRGMNQIEAPGKALPPSARYERRVGVSLVRAAWERRPEGPAYLLSICDAPISRRPVCFLMHTLTPLDQWNSERVFPRVPTIPDPSPLTVFSSGRDPQVQSSSLEKAFFCFFSGDIRARRRPRQKLLCFWVRLVVRSRDRATPPTNVSTILVNAASN